MRSTIAFVLLCIGQMVFADTPQVVDAKATFQNGSWRFDVTLSHADTGWDHYADGWGVYLADDTELGYRELLHPHVNEQPFTRSLSGIKIPDGVASVFIKPRDNIHGEGGTFELILP